MNKSKTGKKLLSLLLSVLMCLSFVPTVAFATEESGSDTFVAKIGDTEYETLQAAFDAAKTGDTVTLLSDITLTEQVNITKALDGLTLDGNGKTITCATTDDPFKSGGSALYFGNADSKLYCTGIKIKDLNMVGKARFAIFLCGGTTTEFTNVNISGNYYIAVNLYGTHGATMNNCNISNSTDGTDKYISGVWSNVASANPLILNNTTVDVIAINTYTTANTLAPKILINEGSKAEIHTFDDGSVSGDKFLCVNKESKGEYSVKEYNETDKTWENVSVAEVGGIKYATLAAAVAAAKNGETVTLLADVNNSPSIAISKNITIDFGEYTVTGKAGAYVIFVTNADVTLKGTTGGVNGGSGGNNVAVLANTGANITIEGGVYTVGGDANGKANATVYATNGGNVTVTGGTFSSEIPMGGKYYVLNINNGSSSSKITVLGGTFINFNPLKGDDNLGGNFCPDYVGVSYNAETGEFTASSEMKIQVTGKDGSLKAYEDFSAAAEQLKDGDTVRLLADTTEDINISQNITLDLGGKTLTGTGAASTATLTVVKGAVVTVKNGNIVGTANSYYNIQNNGTAIFEDITATAGNIGSSMIDNWGTLTINSGNYTGGLNVVKSEEDSTLIFNGGKFVSDYAPKYGITGTVLVYGDTTINGGVFIQNGNSTNARVIVTGIVPGHAVKTVITGGSFTNNSNKNILHRLTPVSYKEFVVSGGTFNEQIPDGHCADGFIQVKNSDGTYGVKEGKYVAKIGSTGYETLESAIKDAKLNNTVKLLEDITLTEQLTVSKKITLDLNGKTLTSTFAMADGAAGEARYALLLKNAVTVKNGTFAAGKARAIGAYGALTLDSVTVSTELTNGNACVALCANDATYTVKNSTVSGAYALSIFANNATVNVTESVLTGNGNVLYHNGSNYGLKLTVSNTEITSTGSCGVYISGSTVTRDAAGYQNATFTNCTVTGAANGVEVKYTDLTLDGCTVKTTATTASYNQNNDGPAANGFAVVSTDNAVKGTTPKPEGTVIITGDGKYTGLVGLASLVSVKENYSDFADNTIKISGGTFSNEVLADYCADGYVPTKNADGTYGVTKDIAQYEVSLTLKDSIDVNMYVKLPVGTAADIVNKYSVKVKFNGVETEYKLIKTSSDSTYDYYKIVIASAFSYEMTKPIDVTVYYDGAIVKYVEGYSVQKYLIDSYNDETQEKYKELYKAALDYGANAQLFFNGRTYEGKKYETDVDNLANATVNPNNEIVAIPEDYVKKSEAEGSVSGIVADKTGVSLILGSEVSIKYYLKTTEKMTLEQFKNMYNFSCEKEITVSDNGDGYFVITVAHIKSYELSKAYTLKITNGDEMFSLTYSALDYAYGARNDADGLGMLCRALYAYSQAADAIWN